MLQLQGRPQGVQYGLQFQRPSDVRLIAQDRFRPAMTRYIRIVQYNVNKQRVLSLQLRDFCAETPADVILIQEPVLCSKNVYSFKNCKQYSITTMPTKTKSQ